MTRKKGVVNIHGKQYKTVVLRVNEFRESCSASEGWGIETDIIELSEKWACVKARIVNPGGKIVGSGHGIEFWGGTNINKTSALENAETSAVGRALAAIGLGGEEYASADEVLSAIKTQEEMEKKPEPSPVEPDSPGDRTHNTDVALSNLKVIVDNFGQSGRNWHKQILSNFYQIDESDIKKNNNRGLDLLDDEQLKDFIEKQNIKLEDVKE